MESTYKNQEKKLFDFIDQEMFDIFKENMVFVAGGAITSIFCGRDINDIDLYFRDKESLIKTIEDLSSSATISSYTDKSITFIRNTRSRSIIIQAVFFDYFSTAQQVFEAFDFSCCMGAYDFAECKFVLHDSFVVDNLARKLNVIGKTRFPFSSIMRIKKYEERGYAIDKANMMKLCLLCSTQKIESWQDVIINVGGIYGENTSKFFDMKKQFSIEEALKQLSYINDEKEIKINMDNEEFNMKKFIVSVLGRKIKAVKLNENDHLVYVKDDGAIVAEKYDESIHEICDNYREIFPLNLYKVVKSTDKEDIFCSCHDNTFTYKVGTTCSSRLPGVFFTVKEKIEVWKKMFGFPDKGDRIVLECTYDMKDIIDVGSDKISLKSAFITRKFTLKEFYETVGKGINTNEDSLPF